MNINKTNKSLTVLLIITLITYGLKIFKITFFSNSFADFIKNTNIISLIVNKTTIDAEQVQLAFNFLNNASDGIKTIFIILAVFALLSTIVTLFVVKIFAKRTSKYNSLFSNSGLLLTSIFALYTQYKFLPSLNNFYNGLIVLVSVITIIVLVITLIISTKNIIDIIKRNKSNFSVFGYDIAKVLTLIIIVITGSVISIKMGSYIVVAVIINSIDFAKLINIMDIVSIDWNSILPPFIQSIEIINPLTINMFINNLFDQYVLSFVTDAFHKFSLSIARSIIFSGIYMYISSLLLAISYLVGSKLKFAYKDYIMIAILVVLSVVLIFGFNSFIMTTLAILLIGCASLISYNYLVKVINRYKK